ncbi:unnamed protein product [Hyaloperonospora brassicae]|uniref:Uncharacterized protein n=1 Tax=Hyaloperonospora brassicae TaxID=162125 RepID=A0AAV0U6T5_HYABA|nr:unnamed protein product [Hyaloperonospora brassicae]
MLDHLLPLLYCESYEYLDESDKENYGYLIRRRARPVSSQVPAASRTPPRPPRRTASRAQDPRRNLKRRRERSDNGSDDDDLHDRRDVKRRKTQSAVNVQAPTAPVQRSRHQEQAPLVPLETDDKQKQEAVPVTPQQQKPAPKSTISAKKSAAKATQSTKKKTKKVTTKSTKVTADAKPKKTVKKVFKGATPKRMPLQDITHLYVNERARSCEYRQRTRFVAGLTTSVAIRFF